MLKLKDILSSPSKIKNQSDYYVTIKILFEKVELSEGVCYWNAYGEENSLVQIGLSNPTGAIYKIVVFLHTTIRYVIDSNVEIIKANAYKKIGLPLFETYREKYKEGYYHLDEKVDFKVYSDKTSTTILISSSTIVFNVINGSVVFGFDIDNNLCYIHLQGMVLNKENFLEVIH